MLIKKNYLEVHDGTVEAGRTPVPALHAQLAVEHVHVVIVAEELGKTFFFLKKFKIVNILYFTSLFPKPFKLATPLLSNKDI